jgi:hypothetical protein
MADRKYYDTMQLQMNDLSRQIGILKLRLDRLDGIDKVRCRSAIRRLEKRAQGLRDRWRILSKDGAGFWQNIKADALIVADDFQSALDGFFSRLDQKYWN